MVSAAEDYKLLAHLHSQIRCGILQERAFVTTKGKLEAVERVAQGLMTIDCSADLVWVKVTVLDQS